MVRLLIDFVSVSCFLQFLKFGRCEVVMSTVVFMPQRHTSREAASNACREDIASSDINVMQLYVGHGGQIHRKMFL